MSELLIETPRLILRPPRLSDFDAWATFMASGEYVRFIGGELSRPPAWRNLMTVMGSWSAHGYGFFSVIEKSSGEWVGRLGPWQPEGWPGTEVGWGIKESEAGKGYASEGAAAAIRWAFEHLGWSEVIHTIAEDNVTSKRVAEKLGSRYLRMGRMAEPYDKVLVEIWGQSRHDWESNSPTVGMSEAG